MESENKKTIQESFSIQANSFDGYATHIAKDEYMSFIIQKLQLDGTEAVLEIASGTCATGRTIARNVKKVTCLDMTPSMLEQGCKIADEQNIKNMEFVVGDAISVPFDENSFDMVITRLSMHHFPNPELPFKEMYRVLKPGGKLVIIDMVTEDHPYRHRRDELERLRDISHEKNMTENEIADIYKRYNLQIVELEKTSFSVSVNEWLNLTQTTGKNRTTILKAFDDELESGELSGFSPYIKDGEMFYNQHWIMVVGIKQN